MLNLPKEMYASCPRLGEENRVFLPLVPMQPAQMMENVHFPLALWEEYPDKLDNKPFQWM